MAYSALIRHWGLFAAMVFLLIGMTLAHQQAGPISGHGTLMRYAFWMATAAATFLAWWLSQWLILYGHERLSRGALLASCFLATLLYLPASLMLDALFSMPEAEPFGFSRVGREWLASALPVFSSCLIASLPAWLSTSEPTPQARAPNLDREVVTGSRMTGTAHLAEPLIGSLAAIPVDAPAESPAETSPGISDHPGGGLLPISVRGGVLRATADLQYVHLQSPEGMTTVPGPMHRVIALLGGDGLEVRRGEWIADRHVKQVKSARGRWVVLLKDGRQVTVSRRRLTAVRERWGSTRFN